MSRSCLWNKFERWIESPFEESILHSDKVFPAPQREKDRMKGNRALLLNAAQAHANNLFTSAASLVGAWQALPVQT